ncbi:MAG TPA: S26 family signal peptidase [Thermoanaerobaculia bacterium]|nr:S26 family signal peptidase [Thermoanaerobaculia bacterium]
MGAAAGVVAAAALLGAGRINTSASLPRGLYLEIPCGWLRRQPARGDLVLACPPAAGAELARRRGYLGEGPCATRATRAAGAGGGVSGGGAAGSDSTGGGGAAGAGGGVAPLGKLVLAVAGDEVALGAAGLIVNGRAVAGSLPLARDSAGRPLAHQPFGTRRLAPGEVWLFSPFHPRSYDSRYFGPVQAAAIRGWLMPLLIVADDRFPERRIHRFHLAAVAAPPD